MTWRQRLSSRIIAATLAVLALGIAASSWLTINAEQSALNAQVDTFGQALARTIASLSVDDLESGNVSALSDKLKHVAVSESEVAFVVIENTTRAEVIRARADSSRDTGSGQSGHVEFTQPIASSDGRALGQAIVAIDRYHAESMIGQRTLQLALSAAAIFLFLAVALGLILRTAVARPLARLSDHAETLSQGRYDAVITMDGSHEMGRLADAMDGMRKQLRVRESELRELNQSLRDKNNRLVQALADVEAATRVKGEFIANISHELRTPLNVIVNLPEGLLEEFCYTAACKACDGQYFLDRGEQITSSTTCPDCARRGTLRVSDDVTFIGTPGVARRHLATMYRASKQLFTIISDLLDFNKLESGDVRLHLNTILVRGVLAEVERSTRPLGTASDIELHFEPCVDDLEIRADRIKVCQVLFNLIGNAIKFSPDGGRIDVAATLDGEDCLFCIRDQGIGIPEEKQEMIFESFRQADGGHTREFGGAGLGLSIAKKLVTLHEGSISVDSEEGEGSAFYVRLPVRGPVTLIEAAKESDGGVIESSNLLGDVLSGTLVVVDEPGIEQSDTRTWQLGNITLMELIGDRDDFKFEACPEEVS